MTRALQIQDMLQNMQAERTSDRAPAGYIRRAVVVDALAEHYPDEPRCTIEPEVTKCIKRKGFKQITRADRVFYTAQVAAAVFAAVEDRLVNRIQRDCDEQASKVIQPDAGASKSVKAAPAVSVAKPPRFSLIEAWRVLYCDVMTRDRDNIALRIEILKQLGEFPGVEA